MGHGARLSGGDKQRIKIDKRKKNGICIRCSVNKVKDNVTCDECLMKMRVYYETKKTSSNTDASLGGNYGKN